MRVSVAQDWQNNVTHPHNLSTVNDLISLISNSCLHVLVLHTKFSKKVLSIKQTPMTKNFGPLGSGGWSSCKESSALEIDDGPGNAGSDSDHVSSAVADATLELRDRVV